MKTTKDNIAEIGLYYDIYPDGRLYSKRSHRWLRPAMSGDGGLNYSITLEKRAIRVPVARLVALKYVPSVAGKRYVGFKDKNKYNHCVDNLVWESNEEKFHRGYYSRFKGEFDFMSSGLRSRLEGDGRERSVCVGGVTYETVKAACLSLKISRRAFNRKHNSHKTKNNEKR